MLHASISEIKTEATRSNSAISLQTEQELSPRYPNWVGSDFTASRDSGVRVSSPAAKRPKQHYECGRIIDPWLMDGPFVYEGVSWTPSGDPIAAHTWHEWNYLHYTNSEKIYIGNRWYDIKKDKFSKPSRHRRIVGLNIMELAKDNATKLVLRSLLDSALTRDEKYLAEIKLRNSQFINDMKDLWEAITKFIPNNEVARIVYLEEIYDLLNKNKELLETLGKLKYDKEYTWKKEFP